MLRAIADTHAIIWYLFNDARLSLTAKTYMETVVAESNQIGFSAITLPEIVLLRQYLRQFFTSTISLWLDCSRGVICKNYAYL